MWCCFVTAITATVPAMDWCKCGAILSFVTAITATVTAMDCVKCGVILTSASGSISIGTIPIVTVIVLRTVIIFRDGSFGCGV